MVLFVGNLPLDITEQQVRSAFEGFGPVIQIHLMTDRFSGNGLGFAFVDMPCDRQAEEAIAALNRSRIAGRSVKVCRTPDRVERRARSSKVAAALHSV